MNIKLDHVNYIYNEGTSEEVCALNDISLEFGKSEFIAMIGSTGSGKSTLIQLLNGLLKPTSGDITFNGENIYGLKDEKKRIRDIRCKVGVTFQYPEHQLFEKDVYTDVAFGPKNLGCSKDETDRRVKKALDGMGVSREDYKKSPFDLSGGEMRRVAIAGMLAMEPEMLILDEPTAGLDPMGKKATLNKLKEIRQERQIPVILVSHSMEEVAAYADRVIVMSRSRVLYDLPSHQLFEHYKELEEIGLKAPEVKYAVEALKGAGLDIDTNVITVDEAVKAVLSALGKNV